ncbi:MAG: hypothetical protein U5M53_12940 [Rhodoferax sp.]|nr:hypothetical protein [Rhodoferax sp.]
MSLLLDCWPWASCWHTQDPGRPADRHRPSATVLAAVVEAVFRLAQAVPSSLGGWHLNVPILSSQLVSVPDLSLVGQFDLFGSFARIGGLAATMLVFTLVFTSFFDAMGTMTGLAKSAGVARKDGTFPRS